MNMKLGWQGGGDELEGVEGGVRIYDKNILYEKYLKSSNKKNKTKKNKTTKVLKQIIQSSVSEQFSPLHEGLHNLEFILTI